MEPQSLFITCVDKEGPFLKVWGQTDKQTSLFIEQVLHNFAPQFDNGFGIPHSEMLRTGVVCCAKYKDNKYYRAKIINLEFLQNRYIEVDFLDYGNRDVVSLNNIRSLESFETSFISLPPQSSPFILAEAVCPRGEWNDAHLEAISKEIRYSEVTLSIIGQATKFFIVRLFIERNDLAILLISKGLMRHTSLQTQEAVLLSAIPREQPQQLPNLAMNQSIVTYKAFTLEPGRQYEVYVSYVTDGPCNFSIQLRQSEEILAKLMKEINSMTLTTIEGIPLPGTVCLTRCVEDGHICRAVVTNEVDGNYKVFYVDFGNFEVVPIEALYDIPFKYVIPKAMAIRFALAGVDKSTVTLEMQCAFKHFVDNHLMHMKVIPDTKRTGLPRCDLWDPVSKVRAIDIVNQAAAAAYPEIVGLSRGFSQVVKISYVFSCNKFYAQPKNKENELLKLMLDIQTTCAESGVLNKEKIKIGLPCCAFYKTDQQWYRSQVTDLMPDGKIKVHYVDFGNEEIVSSNLLRPIDGKLLTTLRPQAIECCLNGYQKMEPDVERDSLLEELILDQYFTMKIVETQDKRALIELIDSSNYNVASLLLDKIAIKRSQVSPLLVQAGNKIEHRKRLDKWVERGVNTTTEAPGWRQEGKMFRSTVGSLNNSRENNDNSWRQNKSDNKTFARTQSRRDDSFNNDSNESDRSSPFNNGKSRNDPNSTRAKENDGGWRQNKGFRNERAKDEVEWADSGNQKEKSDCGGVTDNRRLFTKRENKSDFNNKDSWGNGSNERKSFNTDRDCDSLKKPRNDWKNDKKTSIGDWNNGDKKTKDEWNNDEKSSRDTWNNSRKPKDDWNNDKKTSRDDWNSEKKTSRGDWNTEKRAPRSDWNSEKKTSRSDWNSDKKSGGDDWNSDKKSSRGDWNGDRKSKDQWKGDKKPDYKREKSEVSSSGSEKSFRKGFRSGNSRPPREGNFKKFDRSPKGGDFGTTTSTMIEVPNSAPSTAKFETLHVECTKKNVVLSWFHNPGCFYVQVEDYQGVFKQMMEEIQQFYKDKAPGTSILGAPVVGLFPEDNVLYRAEVIEIQGSRTKVMYVDFGNVAIIDKVWPVENRFMELPAQAVCCKLDGVDKLGEIWGDAGSYGPYFDKRQFNCKFGAAENGRFAVTLESDGEDVGSLLVRDGLGKALEPPRPPELPLLIGQQFRAMLLSVNSLADFIITLHSNIMLRCSVFNLGISTETFEQNIRDKIGQHVIVYVDDCMLDDRLEVTLYDQSGEKIKLIDQDEAAFPNVDLLCSYTLLYSNLTGEIIHLDNNILYIHPTDVVKDLEHLLNSTYEYYENFVQETPIEPVEGFIYVVKSSDGNWYRAKVTSITEPTVNVNYIDYGNFEDVKISLLREMTAELFEVPIMAVSVMVTPQPPMDLIGQTITLALTFTENGIESTLPQPENESPITQINETMELQTEPILENIPFENISSESQGIKVILSHTDSPSDFYLQLADSLNDIDELQAILQQQVLEMPEMENPVFGVLCAAPYSLDQQWYRAQVLDADSDITTVRFVDYGNTDVLDNSTTKVKTLPPNLLSLEVYATRCRLKIRSLDEEWTSVASERFEELVGVDNLTVEFIHQDEKINYVELFSNGINVREVLIEENLALPQEIEQETNTFGFLSHLNSPSEFWIQLENCVEELEYVAETLSAVEDYPELEDLAPGKLCAALFPDDQMWYRARILSNTVAGIEVLFVDYGNSCTCCNLRDLPETLVMLPPLAQKCSLQKPDGLNIWGPEMVRKFNEISAEGQTTFNVKKVTTGETASVELLLNEVNVIDLLLPKVVDVKIVNFDTFDAITLEGRQETFTLEELPDVKWADDSKDKFLKLIDGEAVLQCEFLTDNFIRLYQGFNDIRPDLVTNKTPNSTPSKTRNLENKLHSNSTISINDCEDIVNVIIDNTFEKEINQEFVQDLINDIVDENIRCPGAANEIQTDQKLVEELRNDTVESRKHIEETPDQTVNSKENEEKNKTKDNEESLRTPANNVKNILGDIIEQVEEQYMNKAADLQNKIIDYESTKNVEEPVLTETVQKNSTKTTEDSQNEVSEEEYEDKVRLNTHDIVTSVVDGDVGQVEAHVVVAEIVEQLQAASETKASDTLLTSNTPQCLSPVKLISEESPVKFPSETNSDGCLSDH